MRAITKHIYFEDGKVTREFKRDLRKATDIWFIIHNPSEKVNTQSARCDIHIKIPKDTEMIYCGVPCQMSTLNEREFGKFNSGFFHLYNYRDYTKILNTILKIGDEIAFKITDNRNSYLRRAEVSMDLKYGSEKYFGLHNDTLSIEIDRRGMQVIGGLPLVNTICPDNTARALRNI